MIDRVKLLMSVKNLSSAQFAENIGVQRSGISHILSERNKPSLDFVLKIIDKYPDIDETWLLTGKGEMLKKGSPATNLFPIEEKMTEESSVVHENVVKSEEPSAYELPKPITKTEIQKETIDPCLFIKNEIANDLQEQQKTPIVATRKRMVKLIAIYDDNSFKIYHPE